MERLIIDCEQGTDEWRAARLGKITASKLDEVMATGKIVGGKTTESKTRKKYMMSLVGERLTGELSENYKNGHMERGTAMEPEARSYYELLNGEVQQVGFIALGDDFGYSPDGLVGENGLLEIKTKLPHLQIECLLSGEIPADHRHQLQGGLWISGREWIDFVSYWPLLPAFIKRMYRDEKFIAEISRAAFQFRDEMLELLAKIKRMEG